MNSHAPLKAAAGVPPGSPRLHVLGVDLAVDRQGSGPPLVCLHAVGHGARDFEPLLERVRDRFDVIRVDWPGHGRSGDDLEPASARRYARLLVALLDKLGVHSPIVIGNSIGGAAAILYAKERSVRGLVLCDTGGLVPVNSTVRRFCGAFAAFFRAGARHAWWYPAAYRALYRWLILPSARAREQRERIIVSGSELAPVLAQAWESFGRDDADIRAVATQLDVPVWFAWSKSDRVIPLSYNRTTIDSMRHAKLSTFAGGHSAFLEQPDAFAEQFLAFAWELPADNRRACA
jgi:4,5:9,10-diseco-3-hydroxy-5,9,17-trioxoandrosta-1(10),2-diene-4-oate hydrolase